MRSRILALCAIALCTVAGCSSTSTSTTGSSTSNARATFVLTEWKIALEGTIPAGEVPIEVDNKGGEKHEVVIVAAKDVASLPKKADGSVDEDQIPETDKVGESGDVPAGSSVTDLFTFKPGTYLAFCNIVDDMDMSGSTAMGANGNMPMGHENSSTMGSGSGPTPMGTTMGHVHFALGMSLAFTVK